MLVGWWVGLTVGWMVAEWVGWKVVLKVESLEVKTVAQTADMRVGKMVLKLVGNLVVQRAEQRVDL